MKNFILFLLCVTMGMRAAEEQYFNDIMTDVVEQNKLAKEVKQQEQNYEKS